MLQLARLIATLACGLFAGAAVYISFVEHPARMSCATEIAAAVWGPSYKRATVMQAPLACIGALAGIWAWFLGGDFWDLVGAACIFSVVPFTLLIIMPTNRRLQAQDRDPSSDETRSLLELWGKLHAVRSALGTLAFVIYLSTIVWS